MIAKLVVSLPNHMPEESGLKVITANVALTIDVFDENLKKCKEAGMDDFFK
jgi:hypothetical protein